MTEAVIVYMFGSFTGVMLLKHRNFTPLVSNISGLLLLMAAILMLMMVADDEDEDKCL